MPAQFYEQQVLEQQFLNAQQQGNSPGAQEAAVRAAPVAHQKGRGDARVLHFDPVGVHQRQLVSAARRDERDRPEDVQYRRARLELAELH